MKMFEKMRVGTTFGNVTKDELASAEKVYSRYVNFMKKLYGDEYGVDGAHTALSLAEFLLQDVNWSNLASFMWEKNVPVKTKSGRFGITAGWSMPGVGIIDFRVNVKTTNGVEHFRPSELEKADIPPEVLDYVKSTLQNQVHNKVDEAFKEN